MSEKVSRIALFVLVALCVALYLGAYNVEAITATSNYLLRNVYNITGAVRIDTVTLNLSGVSRTTWPTSGTADDVWVNESGDTMTGDLNISKDGSATATAPTIRIRNIHSTIDSGNDYGSIYFYANDSSPGGAGSTAFIRSVATNAGVTSKLALGIRDDSGDASELLTLYSASTSTFNVGIGIIVPLEKLHVVGNTRVSGKVNASTMETTNITTSVVCLNTACTANISNNGTHTLVWG